MCSIKFKTNLIFLLVSSVLLNFTLTSSAYPKQGEIKKCGFDIISIDNNSMILNISFWALIENKNSEVELEVAYSNYIELIDGNNTWKGIVKSPCIKRIYLKLKINKKIDMTIKGIYKSSSNGLILNDFSILYLKSSSDKLVVTCNYDEILNELEKHSKNTINYFNRIECETDIQKTYEINSNLNNTEVVVVTVSGTIYYEDEEGNINPIRYAKLEIFDEDIGFDDKLGTTSTDANGNYSLRVSSDDFGGPDIYIRVWTEGVSGYPIGSNGITILRDDLLHDPYFIDSSDFVENNYKFNTLNISLKAKGGSNWGAFAVFDHFVEAWLLSKEYLGIELDCIDSYWPANNTGFGDSFYIL